MKKYAFLASIIASPAFGHMVTPESEFFKKEVIKNPETIQLLQYCALRGLSSEADCKAEMYDGDVLRKHKIEAASKCLSKSGWEYRAALDKFFDTDPIRTQEVAHKIKDTFWHTYYEKDPNEPKNLPAHRHDWSEELRQETGDKAGNEAVTNFKNRMARDGVSFSKSDSGTSSVTLGGGVAPASATGEHTKTSEKTTTPSSYTQKELDAAYASGFKRGYDNPGNLGATPDIMCEEKGSCFSNAEGGAYPNKDYAPKEVAKASDPKPEAPKVEPKPEVAPDPFAAFSSPTEATGGIKVEEKKEEAKAVKKDENKAVITPVDDEMHQLEWNDCVNAEEDRLFQDEGSKTTDPNAKTEDEKKAEAERNLRDGICDRSYYGTEFCHNWENANTTTSEKSPAEAAKEAYDKAMAEFEFSGYCDVQVLGHAFCKAAEDVLITNPVEEGPEAVGVGNGWQPSGENPVVTGVGGASSWGDPSGDPNGGASPVPE